MRYENSVRIDHLGYIINIIQDEIAENPREMWDNLGTIIHWHKRMNLGEYTRDKEEIMERLKDSVWLPIYMYDHSGVTISTTPFSCPWDSGRVGYIYVEKADYLKDIKKKRWSKRYEERCKQMLLAEIEIFDQYLRGDVYGYVISDPHGDEIESCWGFFGYDHCVTEAKDIVEYHYAREEKENREFREDFERMEEMR